MSITAVSPIDGRYQSKTVELSGYFSEMALIKYRVFVEIKYLLALVEEKKVNLRELTGEEKKTLLGLCEVSVEDAELVKQIETKGYNGIPATNHDVKAVEYFIKEKLKGTSLEDLLEMVHFALTSEDINNNSYALMIRDGVNRVLFPKLIEVYDGIVSLARKYSEVPMLARTHGQPASPTTVGKEMLVFASRLKDEFKQLSLIKLKAKINGATGNYNAHNCVFSDINWQDFSMRFIDSLSDTEFRKSKYYSRNPLDIELNSVTTQIEPHDSYIRVFDSFKRINMILVDFCQDVWRYISDGWFKQKPVAGEIGSSAMPHKVNPIDFENAEGNLLLSNTLLSFFGTKLPVSRLQRDLSDSTIQRNIGSAFAYSLIALHSINKGLTKIEPDESIIIEALNKTPEVMAEAYQNILRAEGVEKPYELLKNITRGKKVTVEDFYQLANSLAVNSTVKEKLLAIKPENYTGIAAKITETFSDKVF